jgi:hypothetical protein
MENQMLHIFSLSLPPSMIFCVSVYLLNKPIYDDYCFISAEISGRRSPGGGIKISSKPGGQLDA